MRLVRWDDVAQATPDNRRSYDSLSIGLAPNPIDTFGRTDALFDMYIGIQDPSVATLIELLSSEIQDVCRVAAVQYRR